jgi:hypothetical protein
MVIIYCFGKQKAPQQPLARRLGGILPPKRVRGVSKLVLIPLVISTHPQAGEAERWAARAASEEDNRERKGQMLYSFDILTKI